MSTLPWTRHKDGAHGKEKNLIINQMSNLILKYYYYKTILQTKIAIGVESRTMWQGSWISYKFDPIV